MASLDGQFKRAARHWKNGGLGDVARIAADRLVCQLYPVLPPLTYKSLRMRLRLGYWPNIRSPRSYNEKIAHRQLFAPHRLAPLVADKWRVRQYVAERGLAHILNEVYFATDDPEKIPFDDLPDRFVIKANHGSAWNIVVTDKRALDQRRAVRQCRTWLGRKFGRWSRNYEMHYDSISPLILVERFVEDGGRVVPLDYKLYCFQGKARYVEVVDRSASPTLTFYDREWQEMEFSMAYPKGKSVPRPAALGRMVEVAECLARGFDFVRVDLYVPDSTRILFGEITVNPSGALASFTPREWDFRLGELW